MVKLTHCCSNLTAATITIYVLESENLLNSTIFSASHMKNTEKIMSSGFFTVNPLDFIEIAPLKTIK